MSPEQAEGREVGPPSDVFSLGAVLAFAATGSGPFGAGSTPALVYRVVHGLPSLDHVPAEVRPLIERCLAKDPGQRPAARDLLAQASAVQPGEGRPAAGGLAEPVTRTFLRLPTAADASRTVTSLSAVPAPDQPQWHEDRRPRRRPGRRLTISAIVAGLLAASAVTGITLTASARQSSAPHPGHTARVPVTMHATRQSPRPAASSSASPAPTASTAPTAIQPASASPTATPSASMTPTATASATPAPTATMTPAATQSATPAPVVTPTGTATPAVTPTPTAAPAATGSPAPISASP